MINPGNILSEAASGIYRMGGGVGLKMKTIFFYGIDFS
jgi:hypothetical protein